MSFNKGGGICDTLQNDSLWSPHFHYMAAGKIPLTKTKADS